MRDPLELISLFCRDGDAAAFREFYRAQAPRLWKFLVARGCAPEDAYDILSEAFLRFVERICRDPRAPVAFLYRIAVNLRIDARRRARARPTEPLLEEPIADVDGPAQEQAAYLRELVVRLPEREQNLLLLRYWIGLSHREVAQALELPEGTVRRQCAEVIAKLRESWGMDEHEPPAEREIADLIAPAFDRLPAPDSRRLAAIEQRLPARPRRQALTWWWLAAMLVAGAASALWWTMDYDSGKDREVPGAAVMAPSVAPAVTGQPPPPSQPGKAESTTATEQSASKPGPVIYQRER